MEFGYVTLSDNHYDDNSRDPNSFVADIRDQAGYAEEVGLHSAWIGEHRGHRGVPMLRNRFITSAKYHGHRRRSMSCFTDG